MLGNSLVAKLVQWVQKAVDVALRDMDEQVAVLG